MDIVKLVQLLEKMDDEDAPKILYRGGVQYQGTTGLKWLP